MSSLLGLKYFSQHFSQIVETDNRDQDQNTRKDGKVRSLLDITLCIAEHASPGSCRRLDAQAEKLSADSIRIAFAIFIVAATIMVGMIFGRI